MKKLLLASFLLISGPVWAQLPTSSYAVSAACPASARNPSQLYQVLQDGSMQLIGTIRSAANGNNLIINGLGYEQDNQSVLYGMRVEQQNTGNFNTFAPQLYRINLSTAQADSVGPVTPPATPPASELTPASGFGQVATDVRQTLNFVADSGPDGIYYTGGATFRIIFNIFAGVSSAQVTDVRLYVGTTNLANMAAFTGPAWQRLDTSDPATAAVVENFRAQTQAYIRSGNSGPTPEGGIQDWVFDKATGNLVSYLGLTDQYLTVRNPAGGPVGITTTVATPLPSTTSSDKNIGAMFSDRFNNVYAVRAATGDIYRIDNQTGDYTGRSFGAALGCTRGDAVSFRDALPLPVTLVRFSASAAPNGVHLSWATASEQNAAYFEVERSLTGLQWQPVLRVPAANAANGKSYSAVDKHLPGSTVYYRLAMHDKSGEVAYSGVELVAGTPQLEVYPNPASSAVNVQVPAASASTVVELRDVRGRLVRQQRLEPGITVTQLPTANLPGGVYLLQIQQGTATRTVRLVLAGN
ncbi:T9SS type A sorting domain-containing protein [Hymenobacter sp. 102]|uniref:T9SS type A sorting domain-containing protein n=1 Tax=Hymenobacter sp. 102 TaxID=3403152 RepID=UPI003CECDF9C